MVDLRTFAAGDLQPVGALALAAVGLVWLIACTNASNLLIARVTSRRRELGVRTALGASRGRIVRYLLAESALLAIGAAAVGLALAWSGIGLLRELATDYVPRSQEIALDGATGWMLLALTLTSGLLFGLVPALHGTGGPVDEALRAWGRSSTGTVAVRRLRRILVGIAVRDHDATARRRRTAAGEPPPAHARRSRLRHAQPDHRLDHRP